MKLFEITNKVKDMALEEIIDALTAKGILKKKLGHGVYGIAFELNNGDVLKIWASDPAYENFLDYCIKHKSNSFLVKVKSKVKTKKIFSGDHTIHYVRLEKLEEPKSLKDFGYDDSSKQKAKKFFGDVNYFVVMKHTLSEDNIELKADDKFLTFLGLDPKKASPDFMKFFEALINLADEYRHNRGFELDLQLKNFGLRDKQPVIMDPVKDAFGDGELVELRDILWLPNGKEEE